MGNRRNAKLYAIGGRCLLALLGLMLALLGSWPLKATVEADDVLVWVNERPITAEQLALVAHRLTKTSPERLNAEQRQLLLDLLVDEELLLQRAETLGMYDADPAIRKALVQAVIDRVVAEFLSRPVGAQQLRHFYQKHQAVFENPMRMAVEALRFHHQRDAERARAALLGGADFAELSNATDGELLTRLPSSPLPAHVLRRYLGATLTDVALTLDQGEVSKPVRRSDGIYLLQARVVIPAEVRDFDAVREEVESEYLRRGRDRALEVVLGDLWTKADVDLDPRVTAGLVLMAEPGSGSSETVGNRSGQRGGS